MAQISSTKDSRFEMRLTQDQRLKIDQAAETKGLTASQWALSNLLEAADRDIREAHIIRLNDQAWEDFTAALDQPMPTKITQLLESEPIWK
ncbi:DUF1778 domain-containing protein [Bifidobacterium callimiconis]|nr:DUF1778 domain-containing protein [Bifidobacterium callimiconis]